jgi:peptide/nickel transport system substrate-binding protein
MRHFFRSAVLATTLLLLGGCGKDEDGPIRISAIGGVPKLRNPNLERPDSPSALLAQLTAQGLVRFEASGQIEPALAQRWIVSDDGLRYTFRLANAQWSDGGKVTAAQVVARLRAAMGPASRNRVKPILGAIDEIEAMTDDVLEISLKAPRPRFLDLLAQPEMTIMREGQGSGPYRALAQADGSIVLRPPPPEDPDIDPPGRKIVLRGERAGLAVWRFREDKSDLVTGGTAGDLPIARAADLPAADFRFDPVGGLFGLVFADARGPLARAEIREALSMAVDRVRLVEVLNVPGLRPRQSLLPPGIPEMTTPAQPAWTALSLEQRRSSAARTIANLDAKPLELRVALPDGPGYRIIFAYLRAGWRTIGVDAIAVDSAERADLRLVDEIAPATMASWYLRNFTCTMSPVCDAEADAAMEAARLAPTVGDRRDLLSEADQRLRDITAFIPLAAPVRWSLVSRRLTGFEPNIFAYHAAGGLIAPRR